MGSRGIANSRPYESWLRGLRRRASRLRWSALAINQETARALPVVVPVGLMGTIGVAAAIVALVVDPPTAGVVAGVAGLLVAATLAEGFPLPISAHLLRPSSREGVRVGTTSLAIVFITATAVLYGWPEAAVVGFLTMPLVEMARRRPPARIVFNTGLYVSAAILAGIAADVGRDGELAARVGSILLAAATFYAVNMVLLSAVVTRTRRSSFAGTLRRYLYTTSLPFLVIASLTATLVLLWERSPFVSIVVVGPLIAIALYERWLHGALERLREFDRLKDEFIAVISHELRTPLTSVYGAALTLQKHHVRDEMRDTLLAIVSDEAGRLARLLDTALSASRLHAEREPFEIEPTDSVEVARAVVDAGRQRLPDGLELVLVPALGVPLVAADPDKLRQVLVNLTENAIKYSPHGGRIEVRIERAEPIVRFSVRDEGIGIAVRDQPHIFERFHRLDPNMTRGVGGTGLGLYICREIVQRMDGRIWVTSREGIGSTFFFELPAAELAI
jgi:signal transduction histidine kinase